MTFDKGIAPPEKTAFDGVAFMIALILIGIVLCGLGFAFAFGSGKALATVVFVTIILSGLIWMLIGMNGKNTRRTPP